LKNLTLIELGIMVVLGLVGGFTLNYWIIFGGAFVSFLLALTFGRKIDVAAQSKTSFDQMGSGFLGVFIGAVVWFGCLLLGFIITII
jgi:hypothetical protein